MLRKSLLWRCAAAAGTSATAGSSSSTTAKNMTGAQTDATAAAAAASETVVKNKIGKADTPSATVPFPKPLMTPMEEAAAKLKEEGNQELIQASNVLYQWSMLNEARISNITLNLDPKSGRGLYATHLAREGSTLLSIPIAKMGITIEALLKSEHVIKAQPPSFEWFSKRMKNGGITDEPMIEQMQLAFLIAIERTNPDSAWQPYFNCLPHPAIDYEKEQLFVNALDMIENAEYTALRDDFLGFMRFLLDEWQAAAPECQPNMAHLDWAWRTVLARQQMFPDKAAPPQSAGKLGFTAYQVANRAVSYFHRFKSFMTEDIQAVDYKLIPTMMPMLDAVGHHPSGNVTVEVVDRGSYGVCAELQAIREIEPGEQLGFCYNRDATIGYTLYRYGFIPM